MFMPLFGKKKEQTKLPTLGELNKMSSEPFTPVEQFIKEAERSEEVQEKEVEVKPERPAFAPIFIKLDRYKQILKTVNEVKTSLSLVKNSFAVLNEVENLLNENMKMIEVAIEKIDKKISALDSEFLRPSGYRDELPEEIYAVESLDSSLSDLRHQVTQLKSELENLR
jgi:chromosome segregation ATPase